MFKYAIVDNIVCRKYNCIVQYFSVMDKTDASQDISARLTVATSIGLCNLGCTIQADCFIGSASWIGAVSINSLAESFSFAAGPEPCQTFLFP